MSHKEYPKYGGLEKNFKGTKPKMSNTNEQAAMDSIENRNHFDTALRNILGHPSDPPFHHADLSAIDLCWKVWNAAKQHARETEPFSKAQENVCECGHTATLHRFGSANFICRVMSPCSKCECPDFRWNHAPPSDEER
jgi:hypothetical protein